MFLSSWKNNTYSYIPLKNITPPTAKGMRQLCVVLLAHSLHSDRTAGVTVLCQVKLKASQATPQNEGTGWVHSHSQESNHDTHPFPSILS